MPRGPLKDKAVRWLFPAFMLISSITLLVIGVPRFLHELMLVPGTPILYRVNAGETVSAEELTILEQSRLDALRFAELPKAYSDLGSSYLARSRMVTSEEDRIKYAEMSIEASMKSLNMAPLNTFAWFRVATAHVQLGRDRHQKALEAWRASIETAKFEPFLLLLRVHLGILLFPNMSPEDVALLKEQLRMAFHWRAGRALQYGRQKGLLKWMSFLSLPDENMARYFSGQ